MHFFDENFWIAVSFIVFLYFAYKPIKKAIINSLDAKINEIKEKLAQTEKIKAEAKLLLEETQKEMENFEEYKQQIINKAKASTEKLIEKRTKEMEIALTRKSEEAIKLIENERKIQKLQQKELALKANVPLPTYKQFIYSYKISLENIIKLFTE